MVMTQQSTVTRFALNQIQGNQIVDWAVVEGNFENLGNYAAHLSLGNSFGGVQSFLGNIGMTAVGQGAQATHRRFSIPAPPANETDRLHFQAEAATLNGTFLGLAGPVGAGANQRKSTLVLHGVEPTGTSTPAGLTLLLDEDAHRASIQAAGTFQDLTAPILQLGAGGVDRITLPATGAITFIGNITLTGDITASNVNFSGSLGVNGTTALRSTSTMTGMATFLGGMDVTGNATFRNNLTAANISGANTTFSGNLTVTGSTTLQGTLGVTSAVTLSSTLNVTGATSLTGALQFAAGAAYIQSYATDTSFVQISKLTVTPGTTSLAGLTVNGTSTLNGAITSNSSLTGTTFTANNGLPGYAAKDTAGTARTLLWLDGSNNTVISAGQGGTTRWVDYANSVQRMSIDASSNLSVAGGIWCAGVNASGTVSAGSQVFSTPGGSLYLRGADGNVHIDQGSAILYAGNIFTSGRGYFGNQDWGWPLNVGAPNGYSFITAGRAAIGGWDPGQMLNVNGNIFANGNVYTRGNTAYRCWDNGDFNYNTGIYGNYLVQRDGNGYIYANYVNMTANVAGGKPQYVVGMSGDNYLRYWPVSAVGPPSLWQASLTTNSGQDSATVTLPYTGYYFAVARCKGGEYSPCWQLTTYMYVGGNTYSENYGSGGKPGHPQWDDSWVTVFMTASVYGAGTGARFHCDCAYNDAGGNVMYIVFCPASDYPGS